jgi:DNA (cytosine-5)-methyltransferase 1
VQKQMIPALTSFQDKGVIVGSTQKHTSISTNGITPTLTSAMGEGGGHIPMHNYDLRIRKLTPKECWRLMGFDDTDFDKAEKVNSNAQLYKQAGNSIVVNVLEAILTNLFLKDENDFEGQINFDMLG